MYAFRRYTIKLQLFDVLCKIISGVMVSVLASSAVNHGFETWMDQTKNYKIGICFFSAKYAALSI